LRRHPLCIDESARKNMRWDKLTLKAQEALQGAGDLADKLGNQILEPEHVLLTLLLDKEGLAGQVAQKTGADPGKLADEVRKLTDKFPQIEGGAPRHPMSPRLNKTLQAAWDEAEHLKDAYLSVEHLLPA